MALPRPMDWSPRGLPAVSPPSPFILEVTGDSDDACDRIVPVAYGSGMPNSFVNTATGDNHDCDGDDVLSCSHESWAITTVNKIKHSNRKEKEEEDADDEDDGGVDGAEDDHRDRGCGIPDIILGPVIVDQEGMESGSEVVKGEDGMRRMDDKLFWETCLAIGYP